MKLCWYNLVFLLCFCIKILDAAYRNHSGTVSYKRELAVKRKTRKPHVRKRRSNDSDSSRSISSSSSSSSSLVSSSALAPSFSCARVPNRGIQISSGLQNMAIADNEIKQTRGWVLGVTRWNGYFTLIFSDIKYKDFIDLIIDQDISYLISLREKWVRQSQLILKLEQEDYMALTSSQNICEIIEGFKKQFEVNYGQKLDFVFLPRDVMSAIKEAFLDCEVNVIHPAHGNDWMNMNFEGFGLVDLQFNAGELLRSLSEHFELQNHFSHIFSSYLLDFLAEELPFPPGLSENEKRIQFFQIPIQRSFAPSLVERNNIFMTSFNLAKSDDWELLINKRFYVEFLNELGTDGGGLTREWFSELFKEIFKPELGLFKVSESNQNVFYPNDLASELHPNYLEYFKFARLMVGVALSYPFPIGFEFADFFLNFLLGKHSKLHDLKDVDRGLYNFLCWLLDNNISEIEDHFYFVYEFEVFGERKQVELKPGGSEIRLTDKNKIAYVRLILGYVLKRRIYPQVEAFLSGFHMCINRLHIKHFGVRELGRLISGLSYLNIDDWQKNTRYSDIDSQSDQILWFWRFVRSLDHQTLHKLLQFATGSSTVPIEGFQSLRGRDGTVKLFQIGQSSDESSHLPIFKTCLNMILIPEYRCYEELVDKFMFALTEGSGTFTLY